MSVQSAAIDRRSNGYFVYSSSMTNSGFWVANGWFRKLDLDADAATIGATALAALAQSEEGRPDPNRNDSPFAPVLEAAGARNYGAYLKGLRSVTLDAEDGTAVTATPMHNAGPSEGLDEIVEHKQNAQPGSPDELGKLIATAFEFAS